MKMGKKVREYKAGDFIFAKVKGYPAWPARVQRPNGKKYFVYFYGTGETANLPPNMIFDYAENKDKFLSKAVKRRDFNDGVRQIDHDFTNNVPLEQVIGVGMEIPEEAANDSANDTANDTIDDSVADTTAADDTAVADEPADNTAPVEPMAVEDSDETGALVIDEGKKGRKSTAKPAPATPKPIKEPKTPRGKKKDETEEKEEEKKDEEIVSRSGRKIRPKRYIDEQTEGNTALPSPAPKKRRGGSPTADKDDKTDTMDAKNKTENVDKAEKSGKVLNTVTQAELEDLKEPFYSDIGSQCDTSVQNCTPASSINKYPPDKHNLLQNSEHLKIIKDTTHYAPKKKSTSKCRKFIPPIKTTKTIENNSIMRNESNSNLPVRHENICTTKDSISKLDVNKINDLEILKSEVVKENLQSLNICGNNTNIVKSAEKSNDLCQSNEVMMVLNSNSFNDEIVCNNDTNNPLINKNTFESDANYINLDINDNDNEIIVNDFNSLNLVNMTDDYNYNENINVNENNLQTSDEVNKSMLALNGMIFTSVNLLNENDSFIKNLSQGSFNSNDFTTDKSRCDSNTSVITLNKTYKDLDVKSFENCNLGINSNQDRIKEVRDNNDMNNSIHVIPKGEDFFNLFKDNEAVNTNKFVAMSTEFGDMGFNVKYSQYIKQFGNLNDHCEIDNTDKILMMYPNENMFLFNKFMNNK